MNETNLRQRLIQLTRDLVLIESTENRAEERQRCFQLVRNHLEELPAIEIKILEKNGYESMLALPVGIERPEILLCGHLDVVHHTEPDSYRSEVHDGKIYGPGTGDMKGQLAIMIELIRLLGNRYPGLSVGMAITSDEERGGENGVRFLLEEAGLSCGEAIIPDGGSINRIIVQEKGIIHLALESNGVSAHAARPWLGKNALEILAENLAAIKEHFAKDAPARVDVADVSTHWFNTCSMTVMQTSNDSPNRIPDNASATLDIRFIPPSSSVEILQDIDAILSPSVRAEIIVSAEPTHLAPDSDFLKITEEVTGLPAVLERASGGSDGRFFSALGIPVLLSGPRVGNLHGRDEWIEINSMIEYFNICQQYIVNKLINLS